MNPKAIEWSPSSSASPQQLDAAASEIFMYTSSLPTPYHDYYHDDESSLTPLAPAFVPQSSTAVAVAVAPHAERGLQPPPVCRFFLRGACRNGLACKFRHDSAMAAAAAVQDEDAIEDDGVAMKAENIDDSTTMKSLEDGIRVEFGPGASVVKLLLGYGMAKQQASKTMIITGLSCCLSISEDDIQSRLKSFGAVERLRMDTDHTHADQLFIMVDMADAQAAEKAAKALHGSLAKNWARMKPVAIGSSSQAALTASVSVVLKHAPSPLAHLDGVSVKVQWYAPSRCAWLYFYTEADAKKAAKEFNGKFFCGRTITTSLKVQRRHGYEPRYHRPKAFVDYIVWVGNLGEEASEEKLKLSFGLAAKCKVKSVTMGDLPFRDANAGGIIQRVLQKFGTLVTIEAANSNMDRRKDDLKRKALARFGTVEAADRACRFFSTHASVKELGGGKLFLQRLYSIKYSLPTTVFDALKREIFTRVSQTPGVRYCVYVSASVRTLSVTADQQGQFDIVKATLNALVEGQVIRDPKNGNVALWNRYISSQRFQNALPLLVFSPDCAVWCDRRRQQIRVFGSDSDCEATIKSIQKHCIDGMMENLSVPIADYEFQYLLLQGRSVIDAITTATKVSKVSLDIKNRALLVEGGVMDSRRVKAFVSKLVRGDNGDDDEAVDADVLCPVCTCPPDEPIKVKCGHCYCQDCFKAWVGTGNIRDFPLVCLVEDCNKGLDLRDLKSNLDGSMLNNLLRLALDCHVRANADKLQFCLSPTCPGIYDIAEGSTLSICSTCSLEICLECKASHTNMSCKDFRLASQPPDKLRMRVIDEVLTLRCPRCQQAFYDFEGCFSIRCSVCPCSFCGWCLKDCGSDAHNHVRTCPLNVGKSGSYFGTFEEFQMAQNKRRTESLKVFLAKLSASQRETTMKSLEQDLADLQIRL